MTKQPTLNDIDPFVSSHKSENILKIRENLMSVSGTATNVLHKIAGTLVAQQKYANAEEALLSIALSAVRRKIAYYQQRIRKFERKYKTDFDSFSNRLKGRATPAQEDDWLNWRSARRMLEDWQHTYQDLLDGRSR